MVIHPFLALVAALLAVLFDWTAVVRSTWAVRFSASRGMGHAGQGVQEPFRRSVTQACGAWAVAEVRRPDGTSFLSWPSRRVVGLVLLEDR